jgi:predicted DNA-binding protein with PD1-like motif
VEAQADQFPGTLSKFLTYGEPFRIVSRIYSLRTGAKVPDDLLKIAKRDKISTALVEAIGGVGSLNLAYFNRRAKKYEEHQYHEFMEVTGIVGNITTKDGSPFLHVHGTFGRRDMSVVGGHVLQAMVLPIMEVVITPTTNKALRRFDEKTGLNVIYKVT